MFGSFGVVKGDTATANPSTYHKAYYFMALGTAWDTNGTEVNTAGYNAMASSDDSRYSSVTTWDTNTQFAFVRCEFNISRVEVLNGFNVAGISQIDLRGEGYSSAPWAGEGVYISVYDDTNALWRTSNVSGVTGTWSNVGTSDANLTVSISDNIEDYVDTDGIFKCAMRSSQDVAFDNAGDYISLNIDYVVITITYTPTPTLTAPALVSPTSGGTGYGTVIGFDWNASTGGTSPYTYEIMVADNLLFTAPDVNVTSISDTNYSYTTGLTPGTTYYWKVRAKDNGGAYSSWATTQSFTTASIASPSFSSPTNGGGSTTVTPTFSWSASTGGSGTYTYDLQVSLLNTFATTTVDQTAIAGTSYTMTSNLTPDVFYARIRSKDSLNNYSAWSSTITFTASTPADGGGGSSTFNPVVIPTVQEPTVDDTSDDNLVTPSSGGSVTNIINKYIINPARTIVLNPLKLLWDWFVGLFHGSSQETLIEPVADEAESEFNRIVKDMSEDWDAFWSDVEIFIEDIKEVLGC
jgi:hypothetical protein